MKQPKLNELKNLCLCKNCKHKLNNYNKCPTAKKLYQICIDASGEEDKDWFKILIRQCKDYIDLKEVNNEAIQR